MIDLNDLIKKTIKKEIFNDNDILNKAARQVLSEIKTKIKDVQGEVNDNIQFKILSKIKKDRENAIEIYTQAYNKTCSDIAKMNLDKYTNELIISNNLIATLEQNMPKKLNENETLNLILDYWNEIKESSPNKGMLMKKIKSSGKNIDMSLVAKLVKENLNI